MSIGDSLVLVQRAMTRYLLPIIAGFSNLGHIITILILTRKHRLANSCSIYLLAASIFGLIITNWAIIPIVSGLDNIDLVQTSLILCRLRGYIIHTCSMCFRYTIVFACIDRYAICNSRVSIRNYCRPRIAYYCVGIITITWTIISVHLLIFESIENGRCGIYGIYGRIFSIYSIICFGAIPTLSMIIFGFLLMFKLRQMRLRVQPVRDQFHLRKNETSLGKVILAEVIASIICTFCYPLMTFYLTLTNDTIPNKSSERIKIESFINFITMSLLFYLNYSITFYVYFFSSKSFRQSVKQLFRKCSTEQNHNTINQ